MLTFVEPTEGAVLTTHKPTLKLSYRDSGQGVDSDTLEIRHNGALLAVTCTHSNGEATCVPTTDLPGCPIALTATIEDFAGNISAPATRSFRINRAPTARAGEDQTVPVGTTVRMEGSSSSDPDNEPLTFVWQFSLKPASSTAILQDAITATPSFVPDVPGLYSLQLTVTDPYGATDTDLVDIAAEVPNHPPTITSIAVTTATVGQLYTYDALYRLKEEKIENDPASINGTISYNYDPVGNRQARTSTVAGIPNQTFTYDANDRLNTDSYDENGNTIGSDGKSYDYDFENHLTNQNGNGVVIVYDGDGNRVAKDYGTKPL